MFKCTSKTNNTKKLNMFVTIFFLQKKLQTMATTDFYGNLGQIIHDILGAGNKIYRDMADVGDHKKRAKYRSVAI